jgi:hypothetical protein
MRSNDVRGLMTRDEVPLAVVTALSKRDFRGSARVSRSRTSPLTCRRRGL